jgi:hypothetical protein
MKKIAIPLVMCVFAAVLFWPFSGESALAAMTLRKENSGKVEIVRGSETIPVGSDDVAVQVGDVVRTFKGGLAQVALEGDRLAWVGGTGQLMPGTAEAQMRIVDTMSVESDTGTVMAEAQEPMKVHFGNAVASASDAVFRVDRRSGAGRVASYTGNVRLSAPGEPSVNLDRLFEAPLTASDLRGSQPYRLNPQDPFDRQKLEGVISLEGDLGRKSAGFANQLEGRKPSLSYFRALADGRNVDALKKYMNKPTIDLLLGFTVAMNTPRTPFGTAVQDAFEYRDEGGSWGVIAAIMRSNTKLLVADLEDIIAASQVVAGGTGGDAEFSIAAAQAAESGNPPAPAPNPPPKDGTDPQPPPDDGGDEDPPPDQEPDECTSGPECDAQEIRDRIFPSPEPSDVVDTLDGL